jgi:hypothetical protein
MGRVGSWSEGLGEAFLARLGESGNAQEAALALGVAAHVFHNRMRRDAVFRREYREARAGAGRLQVKQATVRWSPELGEQFLAIVSETGNARQAAIALGAPNAFNKRMKRDPEFRRRTLVAAAEADARLSGAESPFLPPVEYKSATPPGDGEPPRPGRRRWPQPPLMAPAKRLPTDADALGGFLRPGRKRRPSRPQPVLRRNSRGRMQVTFAREGHWTQEIEEDFLARLRATGNFEACARAVGFTAAAVHERERKWAKFARDCDEALEAASVALTYKLVAHAHALLRSPGEAEAAGIEEMEVPFDPVMAMKILGHIDARKYGRSGKGRRKGAPGRSFQEACESILSKIEAIERHQSHRSGTSMGAREEGNGEGQ